jgi:hypothetical protein
MSGRQWWNVRWVRVLVVLGVVLIAVRAVLPYFVTRYVNRQLARIEGYKGSIDDVDLALIRGAYTIYDLRLLKTGRTTVPFVQADTIDLSVQWNALFEGKVVGELDARRGSLNFVRGKSEATDQTGIGDEWLAVVKDLFPLRINRFDIRDFTVRYQDPNAEPPVDARLTQVRVEGKNFNNTRSPVDSQTAEIHGLGMFEGKAPLVVRTDVQPSRDKPTFDLRASLEKLPLTRLNDLFKAYGNFDVQAGTGAVYVQMKVRDDRLEGSFKPLFKGVDLFSIEEEHDSAIEALWEAVVGTAAEVFENQFEGQIATVVPLSGKFSSTETDPFRTIIGILKNAFFDALEPGFERRGERALAGTNGEDEKEGSDAG